jgi:hypothetical protein
MFILKIIYKSCDAVPFNTALIATGHAIDEESNKQNVLIFKILECIRTWVDSKLCNKKLLSYFAKLSYCRKTQKRATGTVLGCMQN